MMRQFILALTLTTAWCCGGRLPAAPRSEIISETTAARHGMTRPWFTQIEMDRTRTRVQDVLLHEGTLFVQTDHAMIHAIDAETGKTLWVGLMGRPNHPSLTPGVGEDLLAVVNGSRLYVCNRYNGKLLFEIRLDDVPGAGPALSKRRAYVPMVSGMVVAYRLESLADPLKELGKIDEDPTAAETAAAEQDRRENLRLGQGFVRPLVCQSRGRALVQPLVTRETQAEEFVAWATDRGFMHVGCVDLRKEDRLTLKYRLETAAPISSRPTYLPPDPNERDDSGLIFVTSRDGFVYAIRESNGNSAWRFSAGEPILQPAVVIDERLYVATQLGGMHRLNAKTGTEEWWAAGIAQFVAASKQRIYAADRFGRILVLSAETGARLDSIAAEHLPVKLVNSDTDRLYLATETGLIQCLHEVELSEPIRHGEARKQKAEPKPPAAEQGGIEGEPVPAEQPEAPGQEPPDVDNAPF